MMMGIPEVATYDLEMTDIFFGCLQGKKNPSRQTWNSKRKDDPIEG